MGCQASHKLQSSSDFKGVKISKYEQAVFHTLCEYLSNLNVEHHHCFKTDAQGLSRGIEIAGVCLHKDRET